MGITLCSIITRVGLEFDVALVLVRAMALCRWPSVMASTPSSSGPCSPSRRSTTALAASPCTVMGSSERLPRGAASPVTSRAVRMRSSCSSNPARS